MKELSSCLHLIDHAAPLTSSLGNLFEGNMLHGRNRDTFKVYYLTSYKTLEQTEDSGLWTRNRAIVDLTSKRMLALKPKKAQIMPPKITK